LRENRRVVHTPGSAVAELGSLGRFTHMSNPTIQFTWADAWILQSIIYRGGDAGGATLEGIIEVGDAINHAVFNYGELDDGLSRLIEAGHVIHEHDRFLVSPAVVTAYEKISRRGGSPVTQMERLQKFLGAKPWDASYVPPIDGSARVVTREAFDAAVGSYGGRFK